MAEHTSPPALTVAELTRNHTGKRVRIEHEHPDPWAVEGKLYSVRHETEETQLRAFDGKPIRATVSTRTWITVGPAEVPATGNERVTFL